MQYIVSQQQGAVANGYLLPITNNLNLSQLNWNEANNLYQYYPTTRFDYYVTPSLQLTGTWNLQHSWQPGTRVFPITGAQRSNPFRIGGYFTYSGAVNWTMSSRTFNEFRYGVQHSGDSNARAEYGSYNTYNGSVFRVSLPLLTSLRPDQNNVTGRHYITTMYDTATFNRGTHTFTVGGTYRRTDWHDTAESIFYPQYTMGARTTR